MTLGTALCIFALLFAAGYIVSLYQNSDSISSDATTLPNSAASELVPLPNPDCQQNSNLELFQAPPPCPLRNLKNYPEVQRQINLMQDSSIIKALCPSFRGSGPVVTNSLGLPNLASLYLGASIASIRNTTPYGAPNATSRCGSSGCVNIPETIIQPDILKPGNNWHFKGQEGVVVIELIKTSDITGFTIIHPTASELPQGFFKSAPKEFEVYGLRELDDKNPHSLGSFEYCENGISAQTFLAEHTECEIRFKFIEVRFKSNHGNPLYTAVYKFQVHGDFGKPWFEIESETLGIGNSEEPLKVDCTAQ